MPRELAIILPDPALVVLVGAAGSGKTTFATHHFARGEVLSSDAFRALVAGDEGDQSVSRAAFGRLHRALDRRLAERRLTVVDATNVEAYARRSLVRRAEAWGIPAIAIVLDLPARLVLARNATRPGRVVPEAAVLRQLDDLGRSVRPGQLEADGFSGIVHLRDAADVARLRIVRSPLAARPGDRDQGPDADPRIVVGGNGRAGANQCTRLPQASASLPSPGSTTRPNGRARSSTQTPRAR